MKSYSATCVLILVIASLLSGCVRSKKSIHEITAYRDPDFSAIHYDTLAIHFDSKDLSLREKVELSIVRALKREGITPYQSLTLLPPTRTWDSTSVWTVLQRYDVGGYLRLQEIDRTTSVQHIPSKTTTKVEREYKKEKTGPSGENNNESVSRVEHETITTETTDGYTKTSTRRLIRIELVDIATGRTVWIGTRTYGGNFIAEITHALKRDGLIVSSHDSE